MRRQANMAGVGSRSGGAKGRDDETHPAATPLSPHPAHPPALTRFPLSLVGRVSHRRNPTSPAVSDYAPLIRPTAGGRLRPNLKSPFVRGILPLNGRAMRVSAVRFSFVFNSLVVRLKYREIGAFFGGRKREGQRKKQRARCPRAQEEKRGGQDARFTP